MYSENPNWSVSEILSASWLHSSFAVVAESARRVFVVPSMNVIGNIRGFLDLVAWAVETHQISYKKETLNGSFHIKLRLVHD